MGPGQGIAPEKMEELMLNAYSTIGRKAFDDPEAVARAGVKIMEAVKQCAKAAGHYDAHHIQEAHTGFLEAATTLVGRDADVPTTREGGVKSALYQNLDTSYNIHLMMIYTHIAKCLLKVGQNEEALVWLDEVLVICKNLQWEEAQPPSHDWMLFHLPDKLFYSTRFRTSLLIAEVLHCLGNTGQASALRHCAMLDTTRTSVPPLQRVQAELRKEYPMEKYLDWMSLRHPQMEALHEQRVMDPSLTVRGSWTRLSPAREGKIPGRLGFAAFIWNGKLYVAGGVKHPSMPMYNDIWCLDLNEPKAWRELAKYPKKRQGPFLNQHMVVVSDKAYLYSGQHELEYFDLSAEEWGSIKTIMKRDKRGANDGRWWPAKDHPIAYSMCAVGNVLYVFGGAPPMARLGINLLMRCDLSKNPLQWEYLSGTAQADDPPPTYDEPGPRKYAGMWAEGEGDDVNIYIYGGMADRDAAKMSGQKHGNLESWTYDELWRWSIKEGQWRRERMSGNVPVARAEMGCCYNPAMQAAVVFGGYSPINPTYIKDSQQVSPNYSYYADTFLLTRPPATEGKWLSLDNHRNLASTDPSQPPRGHPTAAKWVQVLTQGFPTYRAQSVLLVDPETNRMFLFGGYTNDNFVPARKKHEGRYNQAFGDVWELRVDVPGGGFENVDWEAEARTARAGPWNRCFTCACAGPWKKCGGTCGGKALFCGKECQREGWKEHKQWHKCKAKN